MGQLVSGCQHRPQLHPSHRNRQQGRECGGDKPAGGPRRGRADRGSEHALREKLIALIESETGVANVTESTPIEALGVDSLDYISLIQTIRSDIGTVSIDKATSAQTVGDLMAAITA